MPWLSNKAKKRALHPRNGKRLTEVPLDMRLVTGNVEGLTLYLIVDESDGVIADASFTAYGGPILFAVADQMCELALRKNYSQASRISADMIERALRDTSDSEALPEEADALLNKVIDALVEATSRCSDIHLSEELIESPLPEKLESTTYPGWDVLSSDEKLSVIKEVIAQDIQPYIELDAGGIEVTAFENDTHITVAYQGACVTCPSSTGATLDAINHTLRTKVHPSLTVKPDLSLLQF